MIAPLTVRMSSQPSLSTSIQDAPKPVYGRLGSLMPARALRYVLKGSPYPYEGDGLATQHLSPFLEDRDFNTRYGAVASLWEADLRWRLWILTRKTLGGLETDLDGRVLTDGGAPLAGLYAAGEAAGFGGGGVHGYRSLEGTFLGGCLFSGRVAGR